MIAHMLKWPSRRLVLLNLILLLLILGIASYSPLEKTLGEKSRLVFFHGAWVWAALIGFGAAAAAGLAGLLTHRKPLHRWSRSLGTISMGFWLIYLPISLLVMQQNWNGLFFDEPRWRIPFTFAVVGLLLQVGLSLLNRDRLTSSGNILYGVILYVSLFSADTILHPDSPVGNSSSTAIRTSFWLLLSACVLLLFASAAVLVEKSRQQEKE